MKKIIPLLLIFNFQFSIFNSLSAQPDYEVMVARRTAQLPSYPMAYLYNPLQYFLLTITNNTGMPGDVYLTCALVYNNNRIVYSENIPPLQPLHLGTGVNVIDEYTIEEHFSGRMKLDLDALANALPDYQNMLDQISTATRLPEGNYHLALYVHPWIDATTPTDPNADGNIDEEFEIIYSATAPEIITPLSEQVNWGAAEREDSRDRTRTQQKTSKREDDFGLLTSMGRGGGSRNALTPQRKLTFRWTPVITTSSYNTQFEYTLKIVAVLPQQNALDAIDHNPVVVLTTTRNTYAVIDTLQDLKYQFEGGSSYAMQVQARPLQPANKGIAGIFEDVEISNNGKSQVVTFSWGRARYSIQYNEINAPLDTAIRQLRYTDNICRLLKETRMPSFDFPDTVSPADYQRILDTRLANFQAQFNTLNQPPIPSRARFSSKVYPYLIDKECSLCQPAADGNLLPGRYYYLDVTSEMDYPYHWDSLFATVHYVNGIEADTETDTVSGDATSTIVRHQGKVFYYGNPESSSASNTKSSKKKKANAQFSNLNSQLATLHAGLQLTADYDNDSLCARLEWYHNYKSAAEKHSSGRKNSKGLYHFVVYRSINGAPFVGIATVPAGTESYSDRNILPGQTVRYFVRLHVSPEKASVPSNTVRLNIR